MNKKNQSFFKNEQILRYEIKLLIPNLNLEVPILKVSHYNSLIKEFKEFKTFVQDLIHNIMQKPLIQN